MANKLLTNCAGDKLLLNCAGDSPLISCPGCCNCGPGIQFPIDVYITGGYTGNPGYAPANLSNPVTGDGCAPVLAPVGGAPVQITAVLGAGSTVDVYGAAIVGTRRYSSLEVQAVDACGMLVFSDNIAVGASSGSSAPPLTAPAHIEVTYAKCVAWLAAGSVFAGGGDLWCDNEMGCTPC